MINERSICLLVVLDVLLGTMRKGSTEQGCDLRFKINQTIIIQHVKVVLPSYIISYFETYTYTGISISCIIDFAYNVSSQSLLRGFTPPNPFNSLGNPKSTSGHEGNPKPRKCCSFRGAPIAVQWCGIPITLLLFIQK